MLAGKTLEDVDQKIGLTKVVRKNPNQHCLKNNIDRLNWKTSSVDVAEKALDDNQLKNSINQSQLKKP